MGVAHLDGVAEHAIEADLERRDAGPGALALLEGGDPRLALAGRVLELAQLVVPGLPDEAAVPQRQRRLVLQGLFKQFLKVGQRGDLLAERGEERRPQCPQLLREPGQSRQKASQGDQVARVRDAQRRPAGEPLEIANSGQALPEGLAGRRGVHEGRHRLLPPEDRLAVEQRPQHPLTEQPRPHRGDGRVEGGEERAAGRPLLCRLEQLEGGDRGGIEQHRLAGDQALDAAQVSQRVPLGLAHVGHRGPRGLQAGGECGHAEAVEARAAEVRVEHLAGGARSESAAVEVGDRHAGRHPAGHPRRVRPLGQQDLGGTAQQRGLQQRFAGERLLAHPELAGRDVHQGHADRGRGRVRGEQEVVAGTLQELGVGDGARGDHAHHVAPHDLAALGRLLQLLAHRDLLPGPDEPGDVVVGRVMRHAGHGDALAGRQGQLQEPGGGVGVVVEQLVEIAQAEQQQVVREAPLQLPVLPHHGRGLGGGFPHGPSAATTRS